MLTNIFRSLPACLGTVLLLATPPAGATTVTFSISPAPANNTQLTSATFASNAAADGNGWTTSDGTGSTPDIALTWGPMGTAPAGGNTLELHSSSTFSGTGFTVPVLQFDMDNQSNQSPPDPTIDFTVGTNGSLKLISVELGNATDQSEAAYKWIVSVVRLSDMATVMVKETSLMVAGNRETLTFDYQGLPNENYRLHFFDENANRIRSAMDNLKFSQVALPAGPHLTTNALSATTYSFTVTDSATEAVDLNAAKSLKIDGVEAAASYAKAGAITTIIHIPSVPPSPGSQHSYELRLTGTQGTPVTGGSILRAPWQTNHTGGGSWKSDMVWTRSTTGNISDFTTASNVLAAADTYPVADRIAGAKTNHIHFDDNARAPLFNDLSTPYPLFDPVKGGSGRGAHSDFAMRSTGRISILNGGKCWFLLNTDDGFSFSVDGIQLATQGTRVRLNTLIPANLTAGEHDVELVHFNRSSLAGVSLYLLKGTSDTPPPIWEQSFELLRPVAQSAGMTLISHLYVPEIQTLYLTFASETGATYALEYTNGMQAASGPPAPEKWNIVPGYGAIAGQPNATSIMPLNVASLVAPGGLLPDASRCFFRVRRL